MKKNQKELVLGFSTALIATLSGMVLYLELFFTHSYADTLRMMQQKDLSSELLTLGALPNLLVFFVFLKKKQDLRAKGTLLATFCIALIAFFLKFMEV